MSFSIARRPSISRSGCAVTRATAARGFFSDLVHRYFFYLLQILLLLLLSALVFAGAGAASYAIVQRGVKGTDVVTPNVAGLRLDDVSRMLYDKGMNLSLQIDGEEYTDSVAVGEIVSQTPPAGSTVKSGTVLRVRINRGSTVSPCPDVRGLDRQEAGIALRKADLEIGNVSFVASSKFKRDLVISQDPPPQQPLQRPAKVNLLVSLGPERPEMVMPNLLERPLGDARTALKEMGLEIFDVKEAARPDAADGTVIEQSPRPNASVKDADRIVVTVAKNAR